MMNTECFTPTTRAGSVIPVLLLAIVLLFSSSANAQGWSSLGGGLAGWVYATTVYNGQLIAGGDFPGHVAKFDGVSWSTVGNGVNGQVWSLGVYNNELWVGGTFSMADTLIVSNIAAWDGTTWKDAEGGMDGHVSAMTVYNGKLIAAGYFTTANISANHIAAWDGTSWSTLGEGTGGTQGQVLALTVYDSTLVAAGFFTTAGGVSASHIAKWNGTTWSALGDGIAWISYALAVYDSSLIAGGLFSTAGGVAAHDVAKWNGSSWDSLGSGVGGGLYGYVLALAVSGTDLVAGGIYTTAGGSPAANIARWNGSAWTPMATSMTSGGTVQAVYTLSPYAGGVAAGGIFDGIDGVGSGNICQWQEALGVKDPLERVPSGFRLMPNYPNPFNPATTIGFALPNAGFATLKVYDLLGREAATLFSGIAAPGYQTVTLDASRMPSGVYYYRLQAGAYSETRKLLLQR